MEAAMVIDGQTLNKTREQEFMSYYHRSTWYIAWKGTPPRSLTPSQLAVQTFKCINTGARFTIKFKEQSNEAN